MSTSAHILVVDDEPEIAELLRRYLSSQGYEVSTAPNGTAMRRVLAETDIDLLLLDLGLAGRGRTRLDALVARALLGSRDRRHGARRTRRSDHRVWRSAPTTTSRSRSMFASSRRACEACCGERSKSPASPMRPGPDAVRFAGWTLHLDARRLESPQGKTVELTTGEFELLGGARPGAGACALARRAAGPNAQSRSRPVRPHDRRTDRAIAAQDRDRSASILRSSSRFGARDIFSRPK